MSEFQRAKVAVFVVLGYGLVLTFQPARAESWRLSVRGGDVDLGETPVVVEVAPGLDAGFYVAASTTPNETLPAQVFLQGEKHFLGMVLPQVARGRATGYILQKRSAPDPGSTPGIRFRARGRDLSVELDQRLLTAYVVDVGNKPFYYPMVGPTGAPYTRAYPMLNVAGEDHDHPHQRSCWFTHGNVNDVDFWGEAKNSGTIRETDRAIVAEGPVLGRLATKDDWIGPDGRRVLQDERVATFYRTSNSRIIDFEIKLHASDGPVTFRDTKEGMFGLRVASSMDVTRKKGGKITNAEGLTDEKAWGQASPWVDYIGPVDDKTVGIAVLNHPSSFRYPTTWHVRTYGLFAANPFGWHDFGKPEKGDHTIPAGQTIAFRYRVILHEGDTKAAAPGQFFDAYARPPTLELEKQ